jgi:hypothetical protein
MERLAGSPAVNFKVAVERQDVAGLEFPSEMNQAGVSENHFAVTILSEQALKWAGRLRQLQRECEMRP